MRRAILLLFILLPTLTFAQTYPEHKSVYVNDLANIITAKAEERLTAQLKALFDDHAIEATVLTIDSRKSYGDSVNIEVFATNLFNAWGIGNKERNDGILILIARNDREMRVELGRGYGSAFNLDAGAVVDDTFLPYFKSDKYSEGIERGTSEVIRRIALPHAAGQDQPAKTKGKGADGGMILMLTMMFGFVIVAFKRRIGDFFTRFRSCPNCGRKGLRRNRQTLATATTSTAGQGKSTTTCQHCDYYKTDNYIIPKRSVSRSSSRGGFGGGSSSGGGASGRW